MYNRGVICSIFLISGILLLIYQNLDPGLVQMASISESYLAQVAGEGAILNVQNAE